MKTNGAVALVLITFGGFASGLAQPRLTQTEPAGQERAAATTVAWKGDWQAFGQALTTNATQEMFIGQDVEWRGIVRELFPPKQGNKETRAGVMLTMTLIHVQHGRLGEQVEVNWLSIRPSSTEWAAWSSLRPGQKVVFKTKLVPDKPNTSAVTMTYSANGKTNVFVSTEGARLVKQEE